MPRRFRAPTGNGEVLADPGFAELPRLVAENRRRLDRADVRIGGMPLRDLRALARSDVLPGVPHDVPLVLAGHQPELSHPGVWVKHFALNGLARRVGGVPLNLVVDNDTLKTTALRLPTTDGTGPGGVRLESVAFDRFDGEESYEDRRVHDPELFRTFADRAAPLWTKWGIEPLLPRVWADVVAEPSPTIGGKFAAVRRAWERRWGCENLERPVSELGVSESFWRFLLHIVSDLPRFHEVYNGAIRRYRAANRIESRNHPAPELTRDGDWLEAPFWVRFPSHLRDQRDRGRLSVRSSSRETAWRIGTSKPWGMPATAEDFFADEMYPYSMHNVIVRPRALTLTLFARLCLGDFFIHGIGGGKYDEVTDQIIRDYFGIEPPAYQVLSATLHLPLPAFPTTAADVLALARRERDIVWNPQRYVPEPEAERPEVAGVVRRQHSMEAEHPATKPARREQFRAFRAVRDELRPVVSGRLAETRDWRKRAEAEAAANAALRRRDFAWVLYPEDVLRPFLERFLDV